MKANSLPKGTSITGSNCVIADDGKITKRVSFTEISEYFRDELSGGGGVYLLLEYRKATGVCMLILYTVFFNVFTKY